MTSSTLHAFIYPLPTCPLPPPPPILCLSILLPSLTYFIHPPFTCLPAYPPVFFPASSHPPTPSPLHPFTPSAILFTLSFCPLPYSSSIYEGSTLPVQPGVETGGALGVGTRPPRWSLPSPQLMMVMATRQTTRTTVRCASRAGRSFCATPARGPTTSSAWTQSWRKLRRASGAVPTV